MNPVLLQNVPMRRMRGLRHAALHVCTYVRNLNHSFSRCLIEHRGEWVALVKRLG